MRLCCHVLSRLVCKLLQADANGNLLIWSIKDQGYAHSAEHPCGRLLAHAKTTPPRLQQFAQEVPLFQGPGTRCLAEMRSVRGAQAAEKALDASKGLHSRTGASSEVAIYAALAGYLKYLLPLSTCWEDACWALSRCWLDCEVDRRLSSQPAPTQVRPEVHAC